MKFSTAVRNKLKHLLPAHIRVIDKFSVRAPHFIYYPRTLEEVKETHKPTQNWQDRLAKSAIRWIRYFFDTITSYNVDRMNEDKWVTRCIFLETVAGVPGMVGGMGRHLRSLRFLEKDKGRIHHLLEEADNERFHLFVFLTFKKPGILFRTYIILAQSAFFSSFMLGYLISPKFCHRFVGYLEEEAVHTYTEMLKQIDSGCLQHWNQKQALDEVIKYYSLPSDATFRDVILSIRADEACHREVNHFFADTDEYAQVEYEETEIQEHVEHLIKEEFMEFREMKKAKSGAKTSENADETIKMRH
jgi:hypothetical protein